MLCCRHHSRRERIERRVTVLSHLQGRQRPALPAHAREFRKELIPSVAWTFSHECFEQAFPDANDYLPDLSGHRMHLGLLWPLDGKEVRPPQSRSRATAWARR